MIIVVIFLSSCAIFFIQVINTWCSKKHFHSSIFDKIYFFFCDNLNFWALFKYLIYLLDIFYQNDYV